MPRPPAVPAENIVDAEVCARAGSTIARRFSAAELPRLREAGGLGDASIEAKFQFSEFDGRPTVSGELHGLVALTCQRCMQAADVRIEDTFELILVDQERSDEPGGFEPVVVNASRLDLAWLAEEQALLALPLVPMHEREDCAEAGSGEIASTVERQDEPEDAQPAAGTTHQPFRNLRDLLRKQ
jgi:uncharacterized protein